MKAKKLVIGITGTPASGKTDFARKLSGRISGSEAIEVNDIMRQANAVSSIDRDGTAVADLGKLRKAAEKVVSSARCPVIILVGHLVQELALPLDIVVIMRVPLGKLMERLSARKYGKRKLSENIVSEALDQCGAASLERYANVFELQSVSDKRAFLSAFSGRIPSIEELSRFEAGKQKPRTKEFLDFIKRNKRLGL